MNSPLEKDTSFSKYNRLVIDKGYDQTFTYTSDPHKPVPFRSEVSPVSFTRRYMTDDQRHASSRPRPF